MDSDKRKEWNLWEDLPTEEEEELIERYAKKIVERDLANIYHFVIESLGPTSTIVAEMGTAFIGPFLEMAGLEKFPAFFRNKRAVTRLNERIDEIEVEYRNRLITRETREQEVKGMPEVKETFWLRVRRSISRLFGVSDYS